MIILGATTEKLELETGGSASVDFSASFDDVTTTTFVSSGSRGNVAAATTTTLVAAPAASTARLVKRISLKNRSTTASQTVQVKVDVSATDNYLTPAIILRPGEELVYNDTDGWAVHASGGARKESEPSVPDMSTVRDWLKTQSPQETSGANAWYSAGKDGGFPGVWSPGTAGVAGRATDGTTVTDAGCIPYINPIAPQLTYLTKFNVGSSIVDRFCLVDVLWVNDALSVTTLTEQAVNSVALPARDALGAINGVGCCAGILVTAATTNAADVTTITLNYTNTAGTTGRTATMTGFATTAVIGTVHWFELQAGDLGVKSIQGITLGTSLVTGSISLFIARRLAGASVVLINVGSYASPLPLSGIRTYDGTCALIFSVAASAGSGAPRGEAAFVNR